MSKKSKILIYGAGVIGCVYAVKLANAGHDLSVYARGSRLQSLLSRGLLYSEKSQVKKAPVKVLDRVAPTDIFDYVFVTVRYGQIETALSELAANASHNIVTMVNNAEGYDRWEYLLGKGRLMPGFAGAGGRIDEGVLHYQLTPKIIQAATFGEADGRVSERINALAKIFKSAKIPYSISRNMDAWQKSHLAMVTVLANGIYFDGGYNYTTSKNKKALRFMSAALRKSFRALKAKGIPITPPKLHVFRLCPLWLMDISLRILYSTKFAETLISSHALNAKDEMALLDEAFRRRIYDEAAE